MKTAKEMVLEVYPTFRSEFLEQQLRAQTMLMEKYADQYKSKWIPVSERLPDLNENIESDYVVCFSEFTGQFIGWYNGKTKIWVAAIYTSNNNEISRVTHWKLKDADPE